MKAPVYQSVLFYYLIRNMKKYALTIVLLLGAAVLITSCEKKESNKKVQGEWKSKDASTSLKITDKKFIMDGDAQNAEDYFTKGDTIFTSFEGNQPYTKFVIKKLDGQHMSLLYPDSVLVEFSK
ncbi:MAG: hypothetical protein V4520_01780 [Bacteroidota bacterium]